MRYAWSITYDSRRLSIRIDSPWILTTECEVARWFGRRSLRSNVTLGHASVDNEIGAVDKAALIAGEEQDGLSLLDGLPEAAGGKVDFAAVTLG